MIIEALKLINLPVAAEDTLSKVGVVRQIVVDPENGAVLGFIISTGIFSRPKSLSTIDIKYWDKEGLVTSSANNIVDLSEIVRIKNVLDKKINLLQMPAQTETGKSLGHVENFLIDTETEMVVKYYLRDLLGKSRVMPSDKVISIDKVITFANDEGEIRSGVVETQTA